MKFVKLKTTIISSLLLFSHIAFSDTDNFKIEYVDGINIKLDQFDQFKISDDLSTFSISSDEIEKLENSEKLLAEIEQEENVAENVEKNVEKNIVEQEQSASNLENKGDIDQNFGVTLAKENQEDYYFIETEVDKTNKSRDVRKAYLKAKSQLLHFLKKENTKITVKLSRFLMYKVIETEEKMTLFFKVKSSDVSIVQ